MIAALFLGLGACAAWGLILFVSDRDPSTGPWPPVRGNLWTAFWAWGLTILIYMGLFQAWGIDWNAFGWPAWLRWGGGGLLGLASAWLHLQGTADLGLKGTSGWNVGVVRRRSYALCRHPQYLGQALGFPGLALIAANGTSAVMALAAVATLVYAARVEDRAMAARHADHAAYRRSVPFLLPKGLR